MFLSWISYSFCSVFIACKDTRFTRRFLPRKICPLTDFLKNCTRDNLILEFYNGRLDNHLTFRSRRKQNTMAISLFDNLRKIYDQELYKSAIQLVSFISYNMHKLHESNLFTFPGRDHFTILRKEQIPAEPQ